MLTSSITESAQFAIAALARELARTFKIDNSNFRYDTFYEACGLDLHGAIPATEKVGRS